MLNEKGERALAYITTLTGKEPIPNYDKVEMGIINGWKCIISKNDNIQIGDKVVYFEVDSKVSENDERFAFLEKRHYKIRTLRMCKTVSQGLIMPITLFPELAELDINSDVTDLLKVTYADAEDNTRKKTNPNAKYESMKARHKKLFKKPWAKWVMKRAWGRKVMFFFFGKKKDNPRGFPTFISKTDEERIENLPWRLTELADNGNKRIWLQTEKLDGTSCTYALERKGRNKFEFYVCSRNVRQKDETQSCYHDRNIYWDLAFKYNIEERLKGFLKHNPECKWVCIQGEGVGSVQGNPLKLKEDDLYVFNFSTSDQGRWSTYRGQLTIKQWGMKWVPVLGETILPDTMDEMKKLADGKSVVNPKVSREGIVYRSLDGKESFKNVGNEYLMKLHK